MTYLTGPSFFISVRNRGEYGTKKPGCEWTKSKNKMQFDDYCLVNYSIQLNIKLT